MAFLDWDDNMSVSIASIDDQHKKLFTAINALYDAIESNKTGAILVKIFKALKAYTVIHFEYEENLFREHGYSGTQEHIEIHEGLVAQLNELAGKMGHVDNFTLGVETMDFLREWLFEHIMHDDKKYTEFLIEKGVK